MHAKALALYEQQNFWKIKLDCQVSISSTIMRAFSVQMSFRQLFSLYVHTYVRKKAAETTYVQKMRARLTLMKLTPGKQILILTF
jgi:hypothetical protein